MKDSPYMKILVEASDVPDKAVVNKPAGEKEYVLRHRIQLFDKPGYEKGVCHFSGVPKIGYVFLVSPNGDISYYPTNKDLKVKVKI